MTTTVNPFTAMTEDTFSAAMIPAMASPETLRLWAEESERRRQLMAQKVIAVETAKTAGKPTGKPGVTRHGVPCTLWYGKQTDKNPTGEKVQVDRHCVVLTLPVSKDTTKEITTNGKTVKKTETASYGPSILLWIKQLVTVNDRSNIPVITPFDNYWFPSGSNQTRDVSSCEALRAIEIISDVHECWIQETEHTELTPATARKVTAAEFKREAVKIILAWHKTHGKA